MNRTSSSVVVHYFDYKSPYAYLAQEETYRLANEVEVEVDWLPHTLDIPNFLGSAELDADGRDVVGTRNPHQWRRVRYAYMDCRREANDRGLVLRGPRKIFDSSLAHRAFLYAKKQGSERPFHEAVFEAFWKRELDIEDPEALESLLRKTGTDVDHFVDYLERDGHNELTAIQEEAEEKGVFGVPSYLLGDELFFGNERIPRLRTALGLVE